MLLDPLLQLLGMKQLRHPTQVGFDGKTLVLGAPRTTLDILCWGVLLTKALVGQRDRLSIIPSGQWAKDFVRLVGGGPGPIHHLARLIDQPR
jgi:hypothetical protein